MRLEQMDRRFDKVDTIFDRMENRVWKLEIQ